MVEEGIPQKQIPTGWQEKTGNGPNKCRSKGEYRDSSLRSEWRTV